MLLVNAAHQGSSRRQDLVDEDEDCLLGGELDALTDDVDELADCEVCGDEVFLLVDGGDVGLFDFLADYLVGWGGSVERSNSFHREVGRNEGAIRRIIW